MGVVPSDGLVEQRERVSIKGLSGMMEWMFSALMAVAIPWRRKGSILSPRETELVYSRTTSMWGCVEQYWRMLCAQDVRSFIFSH
jgi:hypothetical protein